MNRLPPLLLAALAFCILPGGVAWSQVSLSRAVPAAAAPGQTTQVTLHGAKLDGATRIWTSFPAEVEILAGGTAAQVVCKMTLPADAPLGTGGLIVATPAGASNVLLFGLDDMPSVVDNGKNHSQEAAQSLEWPVAVDGIVDGSRVDLYRIEGKAGQRIAAEVYAGRLDSPADPVMRLLNEAGNELQMSDDEAGLGPDCRFEYTFPQDGSYWIQVHDNKYQAGGFYRLRIGDFPLVTTSVPLAARRGSTVKFAFAQRGLSEPAAVLARIPQSRRADVWGLGVRNPDGKSSAITSLLVGDLPEHVEREPNNEIGSARELVIPAAVSGVLETEGDQDVFAFHALAGRPLDVRGVAARLGSPAVPLLAITSAEGRTLAESKFGEVADPTVSFTPPADGTYYLRVQELLSRGGPDYSYRVEIAPASPFGLAVKNDKNSALSFALAAGNGAIAIPVDCTRAGYDGPIELSLEDPASGLRLFNATIPAKATTAAPVLVVPPSAEAGELWVVRLVGRAVIDGRAVTSDVLTAAVLRAQRPRLAYAPAWLDGRLTVATVAGPAAAPFAVTVEPATVQLPRPLGKAECLLRAKRSDKEFKDALQVFVEGLPEGVTAEVTKEGKDADEVYRVSFQAAPDAPQSLNPVRLTAYAAFKGRGYALDQAVPLRIFDPLAIELSLSGPLGAGNKQSLTVQVRRDGDDHQAVALKLEGLPAGVTGTTEVSVPADQSEAVIELTAAADAAPGKHPLVVRAGTTYQGTQVDVKSPPRELEITKP